VPKAEKTVLERMVCQTHKEQGEIAKIGNFGIKGINGANYQKIDGHHGDEHRGLLLKKQEQGNDHG
jgi:hypothetical protein